jgi:hypothetical protein
VAFKEQINYIYTRFIINYQCILKIFQLILSYCIVATLFMLPLMCAELPNVEDIS